MFLNALARQFNFMDQCIEPVVEKVIRIRFGMSCPLLLEVKGQQGKENEKVSVITRALFSVKTQIWEINGSCQLAQQYTCPHLLC